LAIAIKPFLIFELDRGSVYNSILVVSRSILLKQVFLQPLTSHTFVSITEMEIWSQKWVCMN